MKIKDFLDLPEWSSDAVHIDLTIHWGYLDRFKIFLFGENIIKIAIFCEKSPGHVETIADSWIQPLRLFRKKPEIGVQHINNETNP